MTKGERLVLTSVVMVNIAIYLVVVLLAWDALPRPNPVEEIVVGYFPTLTPVAMAGVSSMPQPDPPDAQNPMPSSTPTPTLTPAALACPPPVGWRAYSVQSGDTLFSLARTHSLTVGEVQVANCLQDDLIRVGQTLFLPLPTPTPSNTPGPSTELDRVVGSIRLPSPTLTSAPPPTALPLPATAPTPVPPLTMDPDAVNILLLGTDVYEPGRVWRTDTIILVTVNIRRKTAGMLSIPRDLWVYVPGYGNRRINTADFAGEDGKYPGGGPALVKRTIMHNLGVPVHYYVRGDFNTLIELIDELGGVDVAVDCPLEDIFPDPASPGELYTLSLTSGVQHLDGKAALFYARSRLSTSDFDRSRRQQKVLRGLWDKALQVDILPRVPELWRTLGSAVQTDLSLTDVLSLVYIGMQLEPQNIKSRFIGRDQVQGWVTPQGAQVLLPKPIEMQAALVEFFVPPVEEVTALTAEGARVVVSDGSLAALAADRLRWEGILDVAIDDADQQDHVQTRLMVYASKPLTEAFLVELFRVSPQNVVHLHGLENESEADVVLVLGDDYNPCRR